MDINSDLLDPEQPRKKALVDALGGDAPGGMPGTPGNANTGIGGVPDVSAVAAPLQADAPAPVAAKPDYTKAGQYANYSAYDQQKMARPWDQMSEKYKIGTVLSNFDPKQGLTPDVIAALNGANIHGAKFSGSGDKLTVDNAGGYDRFGQGGMSDVNIGFKGGNGQWGAWTDPNLQPEQPQAAPQQSGGGGMFAGSSISPMLQGDAQSNIQAALQNVGGLAGGSRIQELIKALGGGI